MTYYLKYRPQTLDELDQESVRSSLKKIVESGQIPHALLFSGPKGTGKTSAARILAKVVNCENPKASGVPCNECGECRSISKGQNIDVVELDAASHRGIEDIRVIRDAVKLAPAKSKKKVYIIDEAHMLTTEASNALLKTLEEPPSHVIFILATTNPEKLIDTIRSRTTNILFKKASESEITRSLEKIAKGEDIKVGKDVLGLIAKSSDNSFRDAHKIFEQVATEVKDLTFDNVESLITSQKVFNVEEFLEVLAGRDTKMGLSIVENAVDKGASVKEMVKKVIEKLRGILLSKIGLGGDGSDKFEKQDVIDLIKLFTDASAKIPYSFLEQIPLEIAIIEWCDKKVQSSKKITDPSIVKGQNEKEKNLNHPEPRDERGSEKSTENKKMNDREMESEIPVKLNGNGNGNGNHGNIEITQKVWNQILAKVKPGHTSTEALLRAAKPLEFDGSVLTLGVFYKFHKEHLEGSPHRDVLEEALMSELGNNIRVVCTLAEPPVSTENFKNGHKNQDNENGHVILTEPEAEMSEGTGPLTDGVNGDIIKIAEKIFSN